MINYIFIGLAVLFLILGVSKLSSNKLPAKIWLVVGVIFSIVSVWLWK